MSVAVIDLGYGNLGSIVTALERSGAEPRISSDADEIAAADRVILPGVGAAGYAMEQIRARGLAEVIRGLEQPMLGICLGMQLLFERSDEGDTQCLGIIAGKVRKLVPDADRPVPHMGWSSLSVRHEDAGLVDGDYVYFAHSYACDDGPHSLAIARYGRPIPAAVRKDNFWGAQFHPERSSQAGARFLRSFLAS